MVARPKPLSTSQALTVAALEARLNDPGAFDFEYQPQDGDELIVQIDDRAHSFLFEEERVEDDGDEQEDRLDPPERLADSWRYSHWGDPFGARDLVHQGNLSVETDDGE
jgi:hypothetical protein